MLVLQLWQDISEHKNTGEGDSCDVAQYDTMFRLLDNYPANWFNKGYPKQGEPVPYGTGSKSDMASCFSFYDTKDGGAMFVAIVATGTLRRLDTRSSEWADLVSQKEFRRTVPDSALF